MAVTIKIDGIEVICDTPAEATQMVVALRGTSKAVPADIKNPAAPLQKPTSNAFQTFWGKLDYSQKQFIRQMANAYPSPVIAESLAPELAVDVNQVGWIRRKMNAIAGRQMLNLDNFLEHSKETQGESIKTAYRATKLLVDELAAIDRSAEVSQVGADGG